MARPKNCKCLATSSNPKDHKSTCPFRNAVETEAEIKGENVVAMPKRKNLFDNAVALVVDMGKLGSTRKLGGGAIEVEGTDADRVGAHKKLFECEEYEDIKRFDIQTRAMLMRRCLNARMFRDGVWMVKLESYLSVVEMMEDRRKERNELVDAFMDRYEDIKAADKKALGPNYDPSDYPTYDEAKARFRFDWYPIEFAAPDSLNSISRQQFLEADKQIKSTVKNMTEDFEKMLCVEFQGVIEHMLDKLAGGIKGTHKKFNSDMVERADEFFTNLPGKNMMNNSALNALAKQARDIISGVDAQELRDRSAVRKDVVAQFSEIKKQLDAMIVDKPKRAVAIRKDRKEA